MITDQEVWLKYVFRVLHIGPVIILGGKILNDYLLNKGQEVGDLKMFYAAMGIILMVAGTQISNVGFVNTFILKPKEKMQGDAKLWIGVHHTKLLLSSIILTPLLNFICSAQSAPTVRFYFVLFLVFLSPFMRFYREYYT